jgi:hypothetical protein
MKVSDGMICLISYCVARTIHAAIVQSALIATQLFFALHSARKTLNAACLKQQIV